MSAVRSLAARPYRRLLDDIRLQPRLHIRQLRLGKASTGMADVDELGSGVSSYTPRTERPDPSAPALVSVPADDRGLLQVRLHLQPVFGPVPGSVLACAVLGDYPFKVVLARQSRTARGRWCSM